MSTAIYYAVSMGRLRGRAATEDAVKRGLSANYDGYVRKRLDGKFATGALARSGSADLEPGGYFDRLQQQASERRQGITPRETPDELVDARRAAEQVLRTSPKDRTVKRGY